MKTARTIIGSGFAICCFVLGMVSESVSAQSHKAEIFIGNDKGVGQNDMMFTVSEGSNDILLPTKDMNSGAYLLSIRIQDENGIWTPTVSRMIYIYDKEGIYGAEYFVDEDPGVGNGVTIPSAKEDVFDFSMPTDNLSVGPHTLTVRILDSSGSWDSGLSRTFLVIGNNEEIEWFYDSDPGIGNGNKVEAEGGDNIILLPTEGLRPGAHLLSIRIKDSKNRWTPTVTHSLYVTEPVENVVGGEYFVDDDPGEGNATSFGLDNNGINSFIVPTGNLELGTHYLTLRAKTETGKWMPLHIAPFVVLSSSGIEKIEWKMTFTMSWEDSAIILKGNDIPSGSRVELISVSGIPVHEGVWKDGNIPYIIHTEKSEKFLILSITSPDGMKTVKRIK